ncbi:MAG TPA: hypothetical protein VEM13_09595 [Gemmatimonadales bacterium]|nr:hypothetical protein [Gemmatimonadales bacterium]
MTRPVLFVAAFAACASAGGGTGSAPTASPGPYAPARSPTDAVRYGPSALRYVVHRRLHIQQAIGEQVQSQDVGARIFVAVTMIGPADHVGYLTTFNVDSIVADSGTPQPVVDNLVKARRLVFTGRMAPRGEFVNATPSDSSLAQSVVQLLGNFRDFLPRLPAAGVKSGLAWTDTVETTQRGSGSEVSRRSVVLASAAAWEEHVGIQSLRIESTQTYRVAGSGKNAGQPFDLSGAGTGSGTAFIAADGRYLGGESRDSTTFTIRLPVQGVAVPVVQVTRTTVAVLP